MEVKRILNPVLKANPFSKGTDQFCRLPSSTLLYQPEAINLRDLMRFSVRLSRDLIPPAFHGTSKL